MNSFRRGTVDRQSVRLIRSHPHLIDCVICKRSQVGGVAREHNRTANSIGNRYNYCVDSRRLSPTFDCASQLCDRSSQQLIHGRNIARS